MILSKASLVREVSATVFTNLCAQSPPLQPEWLCIIYSSSQVFPSDLRIFTIIHVVPVRNSRISREHSRAVGVALLMWIISAPHIANSIRVLQFLLFGCPSCYQWYIFICNVFVQSEFKLSKHRKHLSLPRHSVARLEHLHDSVG